MFSIKMSKSTERVPRWYFGGIASSIAVFFTHPLDLVKVHLQTQQEKGSISGVFKEIVKTDGTVLFKNAPFS